MLSIEYILSLSAAAAKKAARAKLRPRVFWDSKDREANFGSIPNFGDYRARQYGWRLAEYKTVDKSGCGAENEPALTVGAFKTWLAAHPEDGWAIIEEGSFQVVVGRFVRTKPARYGASQVATTPDFNGVERDSP